MNIWDVAFDDELAYLVVQGGAFAIPRRGPLTGEDSETTEILSADVAQIEVDDVYVYTIEDAPKRRRGFSLVKRPKKGGAPVGIAASERSARTFTLRDGIAVFAVEGGPITTLRVDGGDAPRAVDATDGVETFAIDGGFLFWVSVRAPRSLCRVPLHDPQSRADRVADLPLGDSPAVFDVKSGVAAWRESLTTPHRDASHRVWSVRVQPA